jgi:hypothetical protein
VWGGSETFFFSGGRKHIVYEIHDFFGDGSKTNFNMSVLRFHQLSERPDDVANAELPTASDEVDCLFSFSPFVFQMPRRFQLLLLCFVASVLNYSDRQNIAYAIVEMAPDLGWSDAQKGWVLSSFMIGTCCSPPVCFIFDHSSPLIFFFDRLSIFQHSRRLVRQSLRRSQCDVGRSVDVVWFHVPHSPRFL